MPEANREVAVQVVLPADAGSFRHRRLTVHVEDTTEVDAPARPVACAALAEVSHKRGQQSCFEVSFRLSGPPPSARWELRAHLDLDADGTFSRGDWITMETYLWPEAESAPMRMILSQIE
jgi:hypothetical protein